MKNYKKAGSTTTGLKLSKKEKLSSLKYFRKCSTMNSSKPHQSTFWIISTSLKTFMKWPDPLFKKELVLAKA
jgi:hypothetical protein